MRTITPPFIGAPEAASGQLIIPDPRWEMPELLVPGRKPVGPVVVDESHRIVKDLIWYLECTKTPRARLVKSGQFLSPLYISTNFKIGASRHGMALVSSSTSDYARYDDAPVISILNRQNFSIFIDFLFVSNVATSMFLFGDLSATLSTYNWGFYLGSTDLFICYVKTSGVAASTTPAQQLSHGNRYKAVATYDGSNIKMFLNGLPAGEVAKTGDVDISTAELVINNWWNIGPKIQANIYSAGIINRALPDSEAASLSADPYQFLRPAQPQFPLTFGVTAPTYETLLTSDLAKLNHLHRGWPIMIGGAP